MEQERSQALGPAPENNWSMVPTPRYLFCICESLCDLSTASNTCEIVRSNIRTIDVKQALK